MNTLVTGRLDTNIDLSTIGHIDDVKHTGYYKNICTCSLCGKLTPAFPIRITWYPVNETKVCITGYFDEPCAEKILQSAHSFDVLSGVCR